MQFLRSFRRVTLIAVLTTALVMSPATAFGQLFEVGGMVGVGSPGT